MTQVTTVLGAHMFNARTSPMRNREHMAEWTLTTNDDTSYIVCTIVELPRHCIVLVFDDSHREVMLMSGGIAFVQIKQTPCSKTVQPRRVLHSYK